MGTGIDGGFTISPGVLSSSEIKVLTRDVETSNCARSRAGMRHLLSIPAVAALARDPRFIDLARNALGCEPAPFGATLFDKSADANWLVSWHQDTALPVLRRTDTDGWGPWSEKQGILYAHAPAAVLERVVALRVHLDNSTADNGPLRVLPGTHAMGVLSDEQIHACAKQIQPVTCTVDRGGVLVMRPLILHASSKVTTLAPRRVIHLEYAAPMSFDDGVHLRAA